MYTHIDDYPELEKFADLITLNVRHDFSPEELAQESQLIAQSVNDKAHEENNKKVAMAVFKTKIDTLDADIKLHASNLTHGFTYIDKSCEMYRDWKRAVRVYFDKSNGNFVKEEVFHPSDYQKKIDFDLEEEARQQQIEENNLAGDQAEGTLIEGTLAKDLYNPVDEVIVDKKLDKAGKGKKVKQIPRSETFRPDGDELPE